MPNTVGTITIEKCEYVDPGDLEGNVDSFPEFEVTGKVKQADGEHAFVMKISLELDGRDVDHEYVSGLNLDEIPWDGSEFEAGQVTEDLYNAIYATQAYQDAAKRYHGN